MDIFLAHSLGLLWLSVGTVRRLVSHPADRLLAAALLTWGNLAATRLLLGLVDRLDGAGWILGTSLALAALLWRAGSGLVPVPAPADAAAVGPGSGVALAFGLTLLPLVALRAAPVYLEQPNDPGMLNVTAWLLAGLGLYRLGRLCALGANTALMFTWLGLAAGLSMTPPGSFVALAPAAAGSLAGLVFARQWKSGRHHRHAGLGALAAILVAGLLSGKFLPDLRWSGRPPAPSASGPAAPDDRLLFVQDLVFAPAAGPAVTDGLRPAEGPFPLRDLPRFRSVRQERIRIVLPAQADLARLRVSFSLGLLQRDKTEILVLFNGRTVRQCRLIRRDGWIDATLELDARPGENILEFADVPRQQELDWRGYLERYPDVMRHVVTHNIPPEEGALDHYELSGRPEGRIMPMREIPAPVRGAYFFVFRRLELEGFR